ncbi:HAMP domain-containing histidine kinase [Rhizobium sp. SEMIA 4085]|jgi:signal transduction histidine kinase|uniref:histidine kinase n=1 Tax=Rhizobium gallicum bv. gallicum R602sp TaxID=1041138 RepID=A0A0B4X1V0_9HYPH|nr:MULTISPECIES: HAMP domain-containing sensor histidine kinase [Rhizobium]AJD40562.1 sensor histidine kinase protein [Rhizobium gallicum bv. gallicum R602sp]NNH31025.1 HAMP domain-containing histidine kinase [Rhizobium sp. SEMIA 4085]TDW27723.1 signal transduction histidine kinase [Rhizobium azibense]
MRIKSLTARVLLLTTVWSTVALVVIGLLISTLYRRSAERGFQDLLRAQLYNVINSVTIGDQGALSGSPQLGDLRFAQPRTGWYWVVEPLGTYTTAPLVSPSLGSATIPVPSVLEAPFDKNYERYYQVTDATGNRVQVAETEVVLDTDGRAARFRVSGNVEVVESDVSNFSHSLYLALAGFGVGSLIVNALAILYGLKPLDKARAALERIRAGESELLKGDFPREILPLANEVNALIDSNRRIVERARMQVGNLAHSLKTPIAVLLNEARVLERSHGELVRSQAEAMQGQVQSYLNRARIAAQRESVLARTDAEPALERLVRVMRRLNGDKEFELNVTPQNLAVAMEQQDLEETVGNLLENASRFATTKVRLSAAEAAEDVKGAEASARRHWVELVIEDDGPGLEPDQIREALKRGRRLDESKPGTGLGLSIVTEISNEYQGRLELSRGEWGGLKARLILPGVTKDVA